MTFDLSESAQKKTTWARPMSSMPCRLFALAFGVLFVIIVAIFAVFDRTPPCGVVDIPFDRLFERLIKCVPTGPTERAEFVSIEGIATVVAGTVFDIFDEAVRLAEEVEDFVGHIDIACLDAGADIIGFACDTFMQHNIDSFTVIGDILIVTHLRPIAINGDGNVIECVGRKQRNGFFGVMEWSDVV